MPLIISYITCWNGAFLINNFVDFWYWWISLRATVPVLNLLLFFSCHDGGLCGAFVAMFFEALVILLAAPSIPFLAVCFILAIFLLNIELNKEFCKMTVICTLLWRHLSFQKSQPSIGLVCSQLMYWLSIRPHSCCWADCVSRGVLFMTVTTLTLNCTYKHRTSGRVYPLVLLEIVSMVSWPGGNISISNLLF